MNPLHELHRAAGASLKDRAGVAVPEQFGDPAAELQAARCSAGLVDRSWLGRLRLTGGARTGYLHRITAQATKDLAPPLGVQASVLERTGKLIDLLTVHAFDDHLLVLTSAGRHDEADTWLRKFIFRDDVQVEDRSAATGQLLLIGPQAGEVAGRIAGADLGSLEAQAWVALPGGGGTLIRGAAFAGDSFLLIGEADAMPDLWRSALQAGEPQGLRPVGEAAFQAARILAGVPEGSREIDEESNPLELGLEDSLDMLKGCFTGQEAIAKMITHEAVKRRLMGLDLPAETLPSRGDPVHAGGERIGRITSVAPLPGGSGAVGLALIRKEHAESGNVVELGVGTATLRPLPFPD